VKQESLKHDTVTSLNVPPNEDSKANQRVDFSARLIGKLNDKITKLENELAAAVVEQQALTEHLQNEKRSHDQTLQSLLESNKQLADCIKELGTLSMEQGLIQDDRVALTKPLQEQIESLSMERNELQQRYYILKFDYDEQSDMLKTLRSELKQQAFANDIGTKEPEPLMNSENSSLTERLEVMVYSWF
jgi:chromosome segregation ATPase